MAKKQKREISVVTIFDEKKDGRQAFIELILNQRRKRLSGQPPIDVEPLRSYNPDKVFSDVRVS